MTFLRNFSMCLHCFFDAIVFVYYFTYVINYQLASSLALDVASTFSHNPGLLLRSSTLGIVVDASCHSFEVIGKVFCHLHQTMTNFSTFIQLLKSDSAILDQGLFDAIGISSCWEPLPASRGCLFFQTPETKLNYKLNCKEGEEQIGMDSLIQKWILQWNIFDKEPLLKKWTLVPSLRLGEQQGLP